MSVSGWGGGESRGLLRHQNGRYNMFFSRFKFQIVPIINLFLHRFVSNKVQRMPDYKTDINNVRENAVCFLFNRFQSLK